MEDKIIVTVGESGSGKSTIAAMLEKEGYNYIQSYTTRPQRYKGEKGHIFVDDSVYEEHKEKDKNNISKMIAPGFFDGYNYWSMSEQYKNKGVSIYSVEVSGIKKLREEIKDAEIKVVYLKCDEDERFSRMMLRKSEDSISIKKDKATQRILNDRKCFSVVPCDYVIDANRPIEEVIKDIKKII